MPHVLQLRHLRLELVFLPICVLCCFSVSLIRALDGYLFTDEHSPGGPADSASSHLISSHLISSSVLFLAFHGAAFTRVGHVHTGGGAFLLQASLTLVSPPGPPVVGRNLFCPVCVWFNSTTLTTSSLIRLHLLESLSKPSHISYSASSCWWTDAFFSLRLSASTLASCVVKGGGVAL